MRQHLHNLHVTMCTAWVPWWPRPIPPSPEPHLQCMHANSRHPAQLHPQPQKRTRTHDTLGKCCLQVVLTNGKTHFCMRIDICKCKCQYTWPYMAHFYSNKFMHDTMWHKSSGNCERTLTEQVRAYVHGAALANIQSKEQRHYTWTPGERT